MANAIQFSLSLAGKRQHAQLVHVKDKLAALFLRIGEAIPRGHNVQVKLLTGLADGADMEGADAFLHWPANPNITKLLVGVFPFAKNDFLQTIRSTNAGRFESLYSQCNQCITLDGRYLPDATASPLLAQTRNRAYRQQAGYLLVASDMLLAVTDIADPGKAGGTFETIKAALSRFIPVLLLSLHNLHFYILYNSNDLEDVMMGNHPEIAENRPDFGQTIFKAAGKKL